ncbi:MAG: Ig-like domain-containing protein, partial [Bacteroidales bacterium]|nr:Ig-like domain-containing protein [Bacteroidales bacterium]
IRYKVVSGSGTIALTTSTEAAPTTEVAATIVSNAEAEDEWKVKEIKVASRGGLKLNEQTLAQLGLRFTNTTSDFKVLIGEISLTRGTSIAPGGMPAIVSSKTMARNYKGVDVKVVFDMTAHDKNSSGRQSYQSIYNSDVNTWFYKIYTQQEGADTILCTATTSWAAYVVGAPYDLEKGGRIRVGVSAVSLDGESESTIRWSSYMDVPENQTVEGFSIDKPIIKAGEKFTVAFDDPTHAAATWVIKASDNDAVKYSTTANKFTTSLSEEGIYDLYLTMNGVTEIYRGKIQISPAEVGALPQINQIKINGEEVNTDEIICLGTPKEITISYTGSESTTIAPSRGLALCEKAFGIPTEQLGFNDYTPFTLTFWINFNSFNHEQDGTQFLNIRSAADSWPASDWGYIWSTITVQDQRDDAGNNKYNEGNLMFHYRNSNYVGVPVPTSTEFVFKPQTWYHVAMICGYENTRRTFSLYINGKLVGGEVAEEALYPWKSSNVIMIGGRAFNRAAIDGTLDEVRLYKKALTASEVKGSMQHQSSSVTDSDFIGYWDFESEAQSDNTMKSIGYNKNLVSGTYEIETISQGNNQYQPQSILFAQGAPFISGTNYQIETKPIWDIDGGSLVSESGDGSSGEAVIEYIYEDKGFNKVSLTLDNGWGSITKTIKLSCSFDGIWDEYLAVTSADEDMGTAEIIEGHTIGDSNDFYAVIGATPKDGYKFTNWTLGGEVVSTDNPYTITSISNTEYVANFEALPLYTIGVSSSDNTKGTAESSSNTKYEGETVTLTATPNDGYKFTNWTLGGEVVSTDNPYQATITANSWFVANFEEEVRYKTIVQTNNEDWGSVNINGEDGVTEKWILAGNSVTVNAIPEAGYEFVEWSIVMSGMTFPVGGASASYTIPELTADMTLKATFRLTPVPVTSINLSESTVEIRQEKELQLTATLLPNNATNKEVLWSSEDIGIAIVDQNGNVTAVSEGTTRIIISAQDGSGVTAECEVTVLPILKGDSNDNEMVTVTDAVNTTNYVAGKEVSVFNYNAADVNSDSNITISDVSGTISIVMAQPIEMLSLQSSIMKNSVSDYLLTDDFVLEGNTPQEVSIKMDNSINYTALQADITTGEGLSICGITLGARADASHRLQTSQLTSSTTRVVIYSLQNRSFKNIDDTLINLQIDSEEGATGDISVSNIYASDNQAQEYILQAIGGANITPTSIQETERQTSSIYSVKGAVIITNSVSKKVSIYSSTGMLIKELYTQSEIEKIELNKGLYIVVVGEKTEKVIVE